MEHPAISWLMSQKILSEESLQAAEKLSVQNGKSLEENLIDEKLISEAQFLEALRNTMPHRIVTEKELEALKAGIIRILPPEIACKTLSIPLAVWGNHLEAALFNPTPQGLDLIRKETQLDPTAVIASLSAMRAALTKYYGIRFTAPEKHETPAPMLSAPAPSPAQRPVLRAVPKPTEQAPQAVTPEKEEAVPSSAATISPLKADAASPPSTNLSSPGFPPQATGRLGTPLTGGSTPPPPLSFHIPQEVPESSITPLGKLDEAAHAGTLDDVRRVSRMAKTKEDIAAAALGFLRRLYHKGAIFVVQDAQALGWRGFGGSFDIGAAQRIKLELSMPSIFQRVMANGESFIGPLFRSEINDSFTKMLQDFPPQKVALFPIRLHDKIFAFLYLEITSEEEARAAQEELPTLCSIIAEGFGHLISEIRQKAA